MRIGTSTKHMSKNRRITMTNQADAIDDAIVNAVRRDPQVHVREIAAGSGFDVFRVARAYKVLRKGGVIPYNGAATISRKTGGIFIERKLWMPVR